MRDESGEADLGRRRATSRSQADGSSPHGKALTWRNYALERPPAAPAVPRGRRVVARAPAVSATTWTTSQPSPASSASTVRTGAAAR